jgi:hypothetical protein
MYWLMELLPSTRAGARRLGLVTLEQMIRALVRAVENPYRGVRIVEVPEIRRSGGFSGRGCRPSGYQLTISQSIFIPK